mmetsp:Transcript_11045/g.27126  ORF Transcript_11045/g.27126 Transcript_11045/m.27126 type:complete len:137 (-) Transcript_11045:6-416(-)
MIRSVKEWDIRFDKRANRVYYANNSRKFTQWTRPIVSAAMQPALDRMVNRRGLDYRLASEALTYYRGNEGRAVRWIMSRNPDPLPTRFTIKVEAGELRYIDTENNSSYRSRPVPPEFPHQAKHGGGNERKIKGRTM